MNKIKGVRNASTYSYRVIYTNEYGSSMGEFSSPLKINITDSIIPDPSNSSTMLIDFNFEALCRAPSVSILSWRSLSHSEILSYIIAILDEDQATAKISIELKDFNAVVRQQLSQIDSNEFRVQIANSNATILKKTHLTIRDLRPQTNYSFMLELDLEYTSDPSSLTLNPKPFKLISDVIECRTLSISEAFGSNFLNIIGMWF